MKEIVHEVGPAQAQDVTSWLRARIGSRVKTEATVKMPLHQAGEIGEVSVEMFEEVDASEDRRWFVWQMPSGEESVRLAVPEGRGVRTVAEAVRAGLAEHARRQPDGEA